jgi:hypothetical protein
MKLLHILLKIKAVKRRVNTRMVYREFLPLKWNVDSVLKQASEPHTDPDIIR